jgi:hypothetical protein
MLGEVLEVQPLQSHPGSLELLVELGHGGQRPGHPHDVADPAEEPGLELGVIPLRRQRPRHAGLLSPVAVRPTVPTPTPQARAIARWARCCSYFSRRISRTCLISSLSVIAVGTLLGGHPTGAPGYRRAISLGTGDHDHRNG